MIELAICIPTDGQGFFFNLPSGLFEFKTIREFQN